MKRKPLVLDDGKISQIQTGDSLAGGNFSFFNVDFDLEIPAGQLMKTLYVDIAGSMDVQGAVEIV